MESDFARVSYTEGVQILADKIENGEIMVVMGKQKFDEVLKEVQEESHVEAGTFDVS